MFDHPEMVRCEAGNAPVGDASSFLWRCDLSSEHCPDSLPRVCPAAHLAHGEWSSSSVTVLLRRTMGLKTQLTRLLRGLAGSTGVDWQRSQPRWLTVRRLRNFAFT